MRSRALSPTLYNMTSDNDDDGVLLDLQELRDILDQRADTSALDQMQQRTWLIHWGLVILLSTVICWGGFGFSFLFFVGSRKMMIKRLVLLN